MKIEVTSKELYMIRQACEQRERDFFLCSSEESDRFRSDINREIAYDYRKLACRLKEYSALGG